MTCFLTGDYNLPPKQELHRGLQVWFWVDSFCWGTWTLRVCTTQTRMHLGEAHPSALACYINPTPTLRVQVPKYRVYSRSHDYDSEYIHLICGCFGPLGLRLPTSKAPQRDPQLILVTIYKACVSRVVQSTWTPNVCKQHSLLGSV